MKNKTNEHIHTSKGGNDECYTPREGVEPLLEFIDKNKIIWCPFDTEESEFVKVFQENNFKVVLSHINSGQDFYNYEPDKFDVIASNPPFTRKRYIIQRALSFNKPFALLQPATCLNDRYPKGCFYEEGKTHQTLSFNSRMIFKNQDKKVNFSAFYLCWDFLPEGNIIRDFSNKKQLLLF